MTEKVVAGLLEDHKVVGELKHFPEVSAENIDDGRNGGLIELPADALGELICERLPRLAPAGSGVEAAGIALPGIRAQRRDRGLAQSAAAEGRKILRHRSRRPRAARGLDYNMSVLNDADAVAAGVAATRGQLDRLVRVWTIGNGIGFGRFPYTEGPWEGGHTVVTLDPKEKYCACGGRGHLEGITGHRAMRLRFLDMEPDEVFAEARKGDRRCAEFVELWHCALAAATASQIHLEGPGTLLLHWPRYSASRAAAAEAASLPDGQNESAAELHRRSAARRPIAGRDRRGCGGVGQEQLLKVTRRNSRANPPARAVAFPEW